MSADKKNNPAGAEPERPQEADPNQQADGSQDGAKDASESAERIVEEAEAVVEQAADQIEGEAAELTLEEQLDQARAQEAEWQDKFMRLHAEWDTYRRRTAEQREEEKARATEDLVSSLLPVLDDFERSIDYATANGPDNLLEGVQQIYTKLVDTLLKNGVEVIDPAGEAFDALEAQAVATVEDASVPDETVHEVYQKGYKMGRKVIRSAMVTVTTGGPKRPREEPEGDSDDPGSGEGEG